MTDNPSDQYRDPSRLVTRIDLHDRFSTNPQGWHPWLFEQMSLKPGETVLDIGCGNAQFWTLNAGAIPAQVRVTLVDLSPGMVEAARKSFPKPDQLAGARSANAEDLPFADASFDVVLASHMMYHVDDVPRAMREVKRLLRNQGRFLCTTNGQNHMRQLGDLVKHAASDWPGFTYIDRFGLENAPAFLTPHFDHIELRRYPDSLDITDADAAVDYAMSLQTVRGVRRDLRPVITDAINHEIKRHGHFRVEKDSGLFLCR